MLFIQTVLVLTGDLFLFKILKNNNLENYALIILFSFLHLFLIPANLKLADNRYKNYTIYVNLPLIIKLISVSAIVLFFKN